MAAPSSAHIRGRLKPMWYAMVELLFVWIRLGIRFADAFSDDFGIALLVTSVFAVLALHAP